MAAPALVLLGLAMAGLAPADASAAEEPRPDQPEMIRRNLFSPDRKPLAPDQQEAGQSDPGAPKANVPPSAIQLDAVFMYGSQPPAALVRVDARLKPGGAKDGGQPQAQRNPYLVIHEGERLGDYQVDKIENGRVLLAKDGQSFVIALHQEGKAKPPEPLAAEPSPPGQQPVQPIQPVPAGQTQAAPVPPPPPPVSPDQPPLIENPPGDSPAESSGS